MKLKWAALAVLLTASAGASAAKPQYTYCKAYKTGNNVISPVVVDRPNLGSEWDAFIKSEGYSRGGCSSSKEDKTAVESTRQSLMIPGGLVYFREVAWPSKTKK